MCAKITPEHPLYFVYENSNVNRKIILDINPRLIWHYYFLYFFQNDLPKMKFMNDFSKYTSVNIFGSFCTVLAFEVYSDLKNENVIRFIKSVNDLDLIFYMHSDYSDFLLSTLDNKNVIELFNTKIISVMNFILKKNIFKVKSNYESIVLYSGFGLEQMSLNDQFSVDIVVTKRLDYMQNLYYFINGNNLRSNIFDISNNLFKYISKLNHDKHLYVIIKDYNWLKKKSIKSNFEQDSFSKKTKYLCEINNNIKIFEKTNSVFTNPIKFIIEPHNLSNIFTKKQSDNKKRFYESLKDLSIDDTLNCGICYEELFKKETDITKSYQEFIENKHDLRDNISINDDKSFCISKCCSLILCSVCAISSIMSNNYHLFTKKNTYSGLLYRSLNIGLIHKCPQCRDKFISKFVSNFMELE